jgi:hypothetical protein
MDCDCQLLGFSESIAKNLKKIFIRKNEDFSVQDFYLRDFSSSCSAAVFGTERVFIDRRVIGAVVEGIFDCSIDEEETSFSFSILISSVGFRLVLLIEFLGEK